MRRAIPRFPLGRGGLPLLFSRNVSVSSTPPSVPMSEISSMCKRRGFIYPGSEIYNGSEGSWDYGPLGAQLKKNVKDIWWRDFIERRSDCVGLDSSIMLNSSVWEAAGHVDEFGDYFVECRRCNHRHRVDHLLADRVSSGEALRLSRGDGEDGVLQELLASAHGGDQCGAGKPSCDTCDFADVKYFNGLFKTSMGATNRDRDVYLRPETAQGIFVNFHNIQTSLRLRLPFGVGQVGKAFRNEVATGQFLFRTREFEQMELEFFCRPESSHEWHSYWSKFCYDWLVSQCGLCASNLRMVAHGEEDLAHYSRATTDIEFKFPFGWGEIWGVSNRGSFDLERHAQHSGHDLRYTGLGEEREPFFPHTIEPAAGIDRLVMALLVNGYRRRTESPTRTVLSLHHQLSPLQYAVLPLSKKEPLTNMAMKVHERLIRSVRCAIDTSGGSIGKKYARNDEIGTPYCVTVDFESLDTNTVTVRCRDSTKQTRMSVDQLVERADRKSVV